MATYEEPIRWRRGVWRLWVVAAVLWTVGVGAVQFHYVDEYVTICHGACVAANQATGEPFAQCLAGMEALIQAECRKRLILWAVVSIGGALLALLLGVLVIGTVRWVARGFRPAP